MKKISLLLLVLFIGFQSFAQKTTLTVEDANFMNSDLYPVRVSQLSWMQNGDFYTYENENSIFMVSAKGGTEKILLDLDMMNGDLQKNNLDSVKRIPRLKFVDKQNATFKIKNKYYKYNLSSSDIQEVNSIVDGAENLDKCNLNNNIAYTMKNNLFFAKDGEQHQITNDENGEIVNGQTVHRVEFGISTGTYWSPDGNKLAFYRKDETMVADYPLVNIDTEIATVENSKYPMAGKPIHHVTMGVYDLASGETIFLKTGEPAAQYLTTVTWGPSNEFIYLSLLNRDQNHLKLNKYNASNGEFVATLFEETSEKYVEPENPLFFNPKNSKQFVWISERDGFMHMYLYDTDGNIIKQITKGDWLVTSFNGFYGKKAEEIYFMATKDGFLQNNLYSVNISSGKILRITPEHGTHNALINTNGKYIFDVFSNTEHGREYILLNNKGKVLKQIKEANSILDEYDLGKTELFELKAEDGTVLQARTILPPNFDSNKKYPVFVYVYGGPHAQLITDSWLSGAGLFLNFMATKGYIVFTLDNRGSANRGRDFEQAIFRNCGTVEVDDQMVGVNYLKTLPYVDVDRIGVDGWSYGGFMTITLMLKNPGVFKVATAGGPVIDWKYYEAMYGERYMDTPESNPEGYENASLLNYVDQLEGKLLIFHGTMDPTVVWQNSLQFINKSIKTGKLVDYFVYPGHGHNVRGGDRVHLYRKIEQYFRENL